jgi:hypothetical protein
MLLSSDDLDRLETPEFISESFLNYREILKDVLSEPTDLHRISKYLEKLSAADPLFDYRIGRAVDGSVTGFVWQTGVMRRDFELFGDVLFMDCLGRSLNDKGWPITTLAMLDGEGEICLPSEAITVTESIDAYVWLIRETIAMTPKRNLCDIKMCFGDGIFKDERLLNDLGISNTCKLVLDHFHLISDEIGAWPKELGLHMWTLLREDLTTMVKSLEESLYLQAYERVRHAVAHDAKISSYVEKTIHAKRHLFANHKIRRYPCNLHRQGSAPSEANHSSIISRVGNQVVEPVLLLEALLNRHYHISAERAQRIEHRHFQSLAASIKQQYSASGRALKMLGKCGYKFYQQAINEAKRWTHLVDEDGSHLFQISSGESAFHLPVNPTTCSCDRWIATNGTQCCHLLMAYNMEFRIDLWTQRWHQRKSLGKSTHTRKLGDITEDDDNFPDDAVRNETIEFTNDDSTNDNDTIVTTNDDGTKDQLDSIHDDVSVVVPQCSTEQDLTKSDAVRLCVELAYSITRSRHKGNYRWMLGAVRKMTEIVQGNDPQNDSREFEEILRKHMNMFVSKSSTQSLFSQRDVGDDETQEVQESGIPRANPPGTSGGKRLRSKNEMLQELKHSKRKMPLCTLCCANGHKAGKRCSIVLDYKALFICHRETKRFSDDLGNPNIFLVEEPIENDKPILRQWLMANHDIPTTAQHLVVKRCFAAAKKGECFKMNPVEVDILMDGGALMAGQCPSYYPAYKVSVWIKNHCSSNGRKRHVLSCLGPARDGMSQELYDYSP